mgnify:CR=1 FL=1
MIDKLKGYVFSLKMNIISWNHYRSAIVHGMSAIVVLNVLLTTQQQ